MSQAHSDRGGSGGRSAPGLMTYEEAVAFLDARIPFGMRPGNERVAAIVEAMAHPQTSYPVLHVSGTNGKFSVAAMATAILTELGMNVGTYTSPHLESVRERIAVGAEAIDEEAFAGVVEHLEPYLEHVEGEMSDHLTYFELTTVMAFEWFFDRAVHAAVIECGLGGEFDATNVADARVAVVTDVTADHVEQFGGDIRRAAWEKAGIVKEGTYAVTGIADPDLLDIVRSRAREHGASGVAVLGEDVEVTERRLAVGGQVVGIRGLHGTYPEVFCPAFGAHQATNLALAVAACEAFVGERIDDGVLNRGLASLRLPGRIEVIARHPMIVCDGGHNPAAAAAVREAIAESLPHRELILVCGMLEDKLIADVLAVWAPVAGRFVLTAPRGERAAPVERLRSDLELHGVERDLIDEIDGVAEALEHAMDLAGEDDLVLVFGSFHTVGQARPWLRSRGLLPQAG